MKYSNIDFAVVYVDPSSETGGDGATPETALNDLPAMADFADNTCYLIRRTLESSACNLPSGSNGNLNNVLLLGMPLPDDTMYEFVPEEAKTAWGGDRQMYANIQSTSYDSRFEITNLRVFLLHRLYIFRDGCEANRYMFYSRYRDNYRGCVAIEHCKFGYKGINLDDPAYTGETVTSSRLKAYCYFYYLRMLTIRDCVFNYGVTGNQEEPNGISCYYADILDVDTVTVNALMYYTATDCRALSLSECDNDGIECEIRNVHMNVFFNGTYRYMPLLLSARGYLNARIHDITVTMGRAINDERPNQLYQECTMIYFNCLREFSVKDIDVRLSRLWYVGNGGCVLRVHGYWGNYVPGVEKNISDIYVQLATEDGIGGCNSYGEVQDNGEAYSPIRISIDAMDVYQAWKTPMVENLIVVNPRGKSIYTYNVRIATCNLQGCAKFSQTFAEIESISTWFPGCALFARDASHIHVNRLTVNLENPNYPYNSDVAVSSDYNYRANIFVDESNSPLRPNSTYGSEDYYIFQGISCASEGAEGHFSYRCPNGIADTWNVSRTGGGTACLKLWNNNCNTLRTMVLGRKPFKGIVLSPTTTGRHMLRLHCACKGYTDMSEMYRRFMLSARVADTGKTYWSTLHGRWVDDPDSVWNNDDELTQFMLEMPIDITEATTVDIRLFFAWYNGTGFVYVDPAIELTPMTGE